jgi:hypothetical protein
MYASVRETDEFKALKLSASKQGRELGHRWKALSFDEQQEWRERVCFGIILFLYLLMILGLSSEQRYEITDLALDDKKLVGGKINNVLKFIKYWGVIQHKKQPRTRSFCI